MCDLFLNFSQEYGFTQIVKFPTRGNNTLDIFATNRPSLVGFCKPVPGISDHEVVMIYSSLKIDLQPIPKRRIYNWSRGDWTEINEKAEYFCNFFTIQTIILTHQLINYGMNLRTFVHLFWILYPRNLPLIDLIPG